MNTHLSLALLVGAVLPFVPVIRRPIRLATTIAHEVGHCIVVVPFGGRIKRIELQPNGSGEAWVDLGRVPRAIRWLVRLINLYAGYSAPAWAGVLIIGGTALGHRAIVITVLAAIGIIALLFVRNAFGLAVVLCLDVLAAWALLRPSTITDIVVASVGAAITVDGVRSIARVPTWLGRSTGITTDFDIAAREFRLPAAVWFVLYVVVNVGVLWLCRHALVVIWTALTSGAG